MEDLTIPSRLFAVATLLSFAFAAATPARGAESADEVGEGVLAALEVGGSLEIAYEHQQDFDLDESMDDAVDLLPLELQLEARFDPNPFFEAFFSSRLTLPVVLREEGEEAPRDAELVVEEAYVKLCDPARGLSLQLGRQLFEDDRQWLYDAELDAVRGAYRVGDLAIALSASRKALIREDLLSEHDAESVDNYMARGTYAVSDEVGLAAYAILSDHREGTPERPVFLGLSALGTLAERFDYWLDVALVRGRGDGEKLRGYGFDLLGAYHFAAPLAPRVILGYAFGSGDSDPDDGRNRAFRQTGLQGNEVAVGGLTPFRYYGEAFDPELSNLSILTAGLGASPAAGISVDLVYHHYRQDEASTELRESGLDAEPDGRSRRLGSEIDLVLGYEALADFRVRGFLGYFMPGRAFGPDADDALFARLEVTYEF
jgi:alginate production protein